MKIPLFSQLHGPKPVVDLKYNRICRERIFHLSERAKQALERAFKRPHAHRKSPYETDLLWKTIGTLNRPRAGRTELLPGGEALVGQPPQPRLQRPLHVAARNGRAELTRWLVEAGADLNAQLLARVGPHEAGETPLLCAARHGHQEVAGYLLDHGATVAAPGEARLSALHVCPDPADPDPATAAEAVKFVTFLFQRKAHQPCRARCVRCKLKAKLCAAVCLCAQAS